MKKTILTIAIAMSVLSMNNTQLKAEDSDPLTGAIIIGSGCLFGTMVGTTALLSADSLTDTTNNNQRNTDHRINTNTGGIELDLSAMSNELFRND